MVQVDCLNHYKYWGVLRGPSSHSLDQPLSFVFKQCKYPVMESVLKAPQNSSISEQNTHYISMQSNRQLS